MKSEITLLLMRWSEGHPDALTTLLPLVYEELHGIAWSRMRYESVYHTLEPAALIHELFFRLVNQKLSNIKSRAQFLALAARIMRHILVDHARAKLSKKRAGFASSRVSRDEAVGIKRKPNLDPLLLDEALTFLGNLDPNLRLIVELKHFGGFNMDEISEIRGLSKATTYRHWNLAKGHLLRYFRESPIGS